VRLPDYARYAIAAVAAGSVGVVAPAPIAGAAGYAIGIVTVVWVMRTSRSYRRVAPWEPNPDNVGLTLSVVQLRDGSWRPEYFHRALVLTPGTAAIVLRQAADQIEDDWR
jgi:hypothetical protein